MKNDNIHYHLIKILLFRGHIVDNGERYKAREIYRDIKALPPVIVRADGRNFKEALARLGLDKPYDIRFEKAMVSAGRMLMGHSGLAPDWAYTFSDEFNVFFKVLPFQGRIEKLDSVVPSYLASALTLALNADTPLAFDARVIPLHNEDVQGYLKWRQAEAWRNHMQSYGFYTLIKEGVPEQEASRKMKGMKFEDIHEMMWQRGINLGVTPGWQRKGVLIYRKDGGIIESWDPPLFGSSEGKDLIKGIIT
ncbi:tRNA(His) guanylyltransferase Thg1 family protein [Methanocella conradii]|uniref:tRNA(His) guanylyltransferase Thg1 family protein n=1 Tax=Methanocella conradii TaxID=1175444 RepID=UPI00157BC5DD|nr:tRNA(His) guanylyltransferase Thg1 family protein [Methanocella conradii]